MKTFKHFISYYKPYAFVFFFDLACAMLISVIDLAFPLLLNYCSDVLFVKSAEAIMNSLKWILIVVLIMYTIRSLCRYYVSAQGHIMGARMERDMRKDLFDQYQRLSFSYYDKHNTGVMMSRVVSDLFDICEFAHHGPENLFISIIKIVGSFTIMLLIYWPLALMLLLITLIMAMFSFFRNRAMQETFAQNRKKIGEVNASLQDSLEGIRIVQSFANEDIEREKFAKSNDSFLASKEDNYHVMGGYYAGNYFFQGLLYVVVLVAGGYFIAKGDITALTLATFALYINVFVSPIEVLIEFTEMFQRGFSGFKRFEEVMEEFPDVTNKKDAKDLDLKAGHIVFDHVSFGYEDDKSVLDDVSLDIPAGTNLALVGPSGSGKTTVCSLLSRFYDVKKGSILIDGQDIRDVTLQSLRRSIGLVSQDVYLFSGTILENIRYGNPDATRQEVMEAAKKANIHDYIMTLPLGYDTSVGQRGLRLSGGQRQRISIARVFLKNPKILILDEATSALDNESERMIQKSLEELSKNRTCITIAHRLSTIRHAHTIVVINKDGLHEQGSHDELMKLNGTYAMYYKLQFEGLH